MKYILIVWVLAFCGLACYLAYSVMDIGKEKPNPGQIWVKFYKSQDPFATVEENDTMRVLAVRNGYVQFNGTKYKNLNPYSRSLHSFLYEAKRIK